MLRDLFLRPRRWRQARHDPDRVQPPRHRRARSDRRRPVQRLFARHAQAGLDRSGDRSHRRGEHARRSPRHAAHDGRGETAGRDHLAAGAFRHCRLDQADRHRSDASASCGLAGSRARCAAAARDRRHPACRRQLPHEWGQRPRWRGQPRRHREGYIGPTRRRRLDHAVRLPRQHPLHDGGDRRGDCTDDDALALEVIVHACGHGVNAILQAEDVDGRAGPIAQERAVVAEVVIVVFENRGPMRCERPVDAGAGGPAGSGAGSAGIDGDATSGREGLVKLFTRPGAAASDEHQPAISERVAEPRGGRGQEVVAHRELAGDDDAGHEVSDGAGVRVAEAAPGRTAFGTHDPSGRKLIVAADLSAPNEAC